MSKVKAFPPQPNWIVFHCWSPWGGTWFHFSTPFPEILYKIVQNPGSWLLFRPAEHFLPPSLYTSSKNHFPFIILLVNHQDTSASFFFCCSPFSFGRRRTHSTKSPPHFPRVITLVSVYYCGGTPRRDENDSILTRRRQPRQLRKQKGLGKGGWYQIFMARSFRIVQPPNEGNNVDEVGGGGAEREKKRYITCLCWCKWSCCLGVSRHFTIGWNSLESLNILNFHTRSINHFYQNCFNFDQIFHWNPLCSHSPSPQTSCVNV